MSLEIDQVVKVKDDVGQIKFIGSTQFAPGLWYGIELEEPNGKNNGTVQGVKYFDCKQAINGQFHGIFVRESMINRISSSSPIDLKSLVSKLQSKLKVVTLESADYRDKFAMLKSQYEEKLLLISDLESKLEMQHIDNEFLRQLKTELEQRVEDLSNKYELATEEISFIQEELEINREIEQEMNFLDVAELTGDEIKLIIEKNRQLEDSLTYITQNSKETESKLLAELDTLKRKYDGIDDLQKKLDKAESTIDILKERLESFADMEKMMERLTVENDELTEQIKYLTITVDELNEIHELDKNFEEDQKQLELELKQELENCAKNIETYKLMITKLEEEKEVSAKSPTKETFDNRVDILELNALKQEIADFKVKSRCDSIQLTLVKSRCDLLRERISIESDLPEILNMIYELKLKRSDVIVLNQFIPSETIHQKFAKSWFGYMSEFIQFLTIFLEFNYDIEDVSDMVSTVNELSPIFEKLIEILQYDNLEDSISNTTQSLLQEIEKHVQKLSTLMKTNNQFVFKNKESLKFSLAALNYEIQFLTEVCGYLGVEKYNDSLDKLNQFSETVKEKQQVFINSVSSNQEIQSLPEVMDIHKTISSFDNIWSVYLILKTEIVEVTESFEKAFLEMFNHVEVVCEELTDLDFTTNEVSTMSVYDYKLDKPDNNLSVIADVEKLEELISKREREVTDLKLNINLLEQNMSSLTLQNTSKIGQLTKELESLRVQEKERVSVIAKLEFEKKELLKELTLVEDNLNKTVDFSNVEQQQEYNNTLATIEKIIYLKKVAKKEETSTGDEDFSWLQNHQSNRKIWNKPTPLNELSKNLRSLALELQPVSINPSNNYQWKKQKESSKFINLLHEEKYAKYTSIKSSLFNQDK
ncbi:hypothetical protein SBY92_003997 [Candida maltosa Xu316]|uniref:CAP-Gly domain-containing protein n=1 Tax=Candida maltosa (strain Xu316) TaxID=1245528 RepID=M3HMK8_CANMX|nr:hypothetical protein G210_0722 [Candida maltosa Xu316]